MIRTVIERRDAVHWARLSVHLARHLKELATPCPIQAAPASETHQSELPKYMIFKYKSSETDPLPVASKRRSRVATLLVALTCSVMLSANASAQGLWPEPVGPTDGTSYVSDFGTLPFHLARPLPNGPTPVGTSQWGGNPLSQGSHVLPVLRSEDGRIEALLFIDADSDAPSLNPVERLLRNASPFPADTGNFHVGAGLRFPGGDRLTWGADLGRNRSAGMALLCNEDIGLSTTLSSLSQHCLLAQLGGEADPLSPFARRQNTEMRLGASWKLPERGLDLSFGLSWLESDPLLASSVVDTFASIPGSTGILQPALTQPGFNPLGLRRQGVGIRGLLDLGSRRWLSLDGQISRTRVDRGLIESLMPEQWNSGQLGLGMGIGDFSGRISGHVIDVSGSDSLWGGLDIGLSWRTPWRAALTIGAKNMLSGGDKTWPQENAGALDETQSRIPYVQYQQDL